VIRALKACPERCEGRRLGEGAKPARGFSGDLERYVVQLGLPRRYPVYVTSSGHVTRLRS